VRLPQVQQTTGGIKMNARAVIAVAVVTVVALGGCAMEPRRMAPPPIKAAKVKAGKCDNKKDECVVSVSVTFTSAGAALEVDPEFVAISTDRKGKPITWTIATPGYGFDVKNGIVILDMPTADEFKCRPDKAGFVCDNKHSQFGIYKYAINVVGPDGPVTLDPFVIND
jgi:hypothetical protein